MIMQKIQEDYRDGEKQTGIVKWDFTQNFRKRVCFLHLENGQISPEVSYIGKSLPCLMSFNLSMKKPDYPRCLLLLDQE